MRSWNIQRVPTVQPSSTSPMRSVSGTTTSVMNSWQNSCEPLSISMRCTSIPGWWIGQHEHGQARGAWARPSWCGPGTRPQSDHQAPVVHIFEPLSTHCVAVAHGGGERAGHVGAAARLGEELHPELLALAGWPGCDAASALRCRTRGCTAAHGEKVGTWSRIGYS